MNLRRGIARFGVVEAGVCGKLTGVVLMPDTLPASQKRQLEKGSMHGLTRDHMYGDAHRPGLFQVHAFDGCRRLSELFPGAAFGGVGGKGIRGKVLN